MTFLKPTKKNNEVSGGMGSEGKTFVATKVLPSLPSLTSRTFPQSTFSVFLCVLLSVCLSSPQPASAITAVNVSNTTVVPSGLVGHWTFDGKNMTNATATDISGSGNSGALIGMTASSSAVTGKIGQSLTFDSVNDKVNMGAPSALNITSTLTISAWIYTRSFGGSVRGRIVDKIAGGGTGYAFLVDNLNVTNGITFGVNSGANADLFNVANVVTLNRWQHVVVTLDGSNVVTVYVNGIAIVSGTRNFPLSGSNNFVVGGRTLDDGRNFDGKIDDVRVYNRAISQKEVQAIYKAGGGVLAATAPTTISQNGTGLSASLVGHWTFDGKNMTNTTATDLSGSGNNGALTGMTASSSAVSGKIGQALNFDAVNDKVDANRLSSLNLTGALTISAWIYPRSYGGGSLGRVVDKSNQTTNGYVFFLDNANVSNGISFGVNSTLSANSELLKVGNVVSLNNWQHVIATIDSNKLATIYVNGVRVGTTTLANFPASSSLENFMIGGRSSDNTRNFDGKIDDVRTYSRALSPKEVQSLYKLGQVATAVSPSTNTTSGGVGINSGLVGHWTFDGKNMTNATATDLSGSGNNGTLTNMTLSSSATIGKLGQALTFSSSSLSYVSVPQNGKYNISTTAFSISLWVKDDTPYSGVSTIFHRFISWYDGTNNVQIGLAGASSPAGTRQFYFTSASSDTQPRQMSNIAGGVRSGWHHILATSDGTTYTLYIDGVVNQGGVSVFNVGRFFANSTTLYLGQRGDSVGTTFTTGPLDDVRIYNRTLSAKDAMALYKLGTK